VWSSKVHVRLPHRPEQISSAATRSSTPLESLVVQQVPLGNSWLAESTFPALNGLL
jgi:hypothetical protein